MGGGEDLNCVVLWIFNVFPKPFRYEFVLQISKILWVLVSSWFPIFIMGGRVISLAVPLTLLQ